MYKKSYLAGRKKKIIKEKLNRKLQFSFPVLGANAEQVGSVNFIHVNDGCRRKNQINAIVQAYELSHSVLSLNL